MIDIKTFDVRKEAEIILMDLKRFLRNPLAEIVAIPDWHWQRIFLAQSFVAIASGTASGLLRGSVLSLFYGLLIAPLVSIILGFAITFLFYYVFQLLFQSTVSFKKLYQTLFYSQILFLIFHVLSPLLSVFSMLGLTASAFVLIRGFSDGFMLPRKRVTQMLAVLYGVFLVVWISGQIGQMMDNSKIRKAMSIHSSDDAPEVQLGE